LNDGIGRPTKAPRNYQFYFEVRRGVRPGPSGQWKIISSLEDYPGRQGLPSTHLVCNNKQRGYRSCLTRHLCTYPHFLVGWRLGRAFRKGPVRDQWSMTFPR